MGLSDRSRVPQHGLTPLHHAAVLGEWAPVEALLAARANKEAKDDVRGGRGGVQARPVSRGRVVLLEWFGFGLDWIGVRGFSRFRK